MIEGADYFVRLVDLPPGVRGMVCPNPDDTYNIYLDSKRDRRQQLKSFDHEIRHILNGDLYSSDSIAKIEGIYVLL